MNAVARAASKIANIGTVALLGYEVGSNVENEKVIVEPKEEKKVLQIEPTQNKYTEEILIIVLIVAMCLLVAVTVKYLLKKRAIV